MHILYRFSVIIPVFNRSSVIGRAVLSVLQQSVSDWELIIVDDGSTDSTPQAINFFLTDARIKYVRQENKGASSARNTGLKISKGMWILFLDSDDELFPKALERFSAEETEAHNVLYGGYVLKRGTSAETFQCKEIVDSQEFVYSNPIECLPAVFFKRQVLIKANGFDTSLRARQDAELFYRLSKENVFVALDFLVCAVNLDRDDRIGRNPKNRYHGWLQFYQLHSSSFRFKSHLRITRKILIHSIRVRRLSAFLPLVRGWFSHAVRSIRS